jgi:hypothetical protein
VFFGFFTTNTSNDLDVDFYIGNSPTHKIKDLTVLLKVYKIILDQNLSDMVHYSDILCVYNPVTRRYYRARSLQTRGYIQTIHTYGGENAYTIYNGQKCYFLSNY